jgi:NAD+ kinase
MPRAAIISKPQKPEMREILPDLLNWLATHGFTCILDPESAEYLGRNDQAIERTEMPLHAPFRRPKHRFLG